MEQSAKRKARYRQIRYDTVRDAFVVCAQKPIISEFGCNLDKSRSQTLLVKTMARQKQTPSLDPPKGGGAKFEPQQTQHGDIEPLYHSCTSNILLSDVSSLGALKILVEAHPQL